LTAAAISGVGRAIGVLAVNHGAWNPPPQSGEVGLGFVARICWHMPLARLLTGLLIGLMISALLSVVLVLPVVLIIRLVWGVWPTPAAWLWIAGVLSAQTVATGLRHALTRRKDPNSPPGTHRSAAP